jgi:photosystem II stability/assembly factor-like uncharacterized protein
LSLTKVALLLKLLVKLRRYVLCGGVAACYVCVLCAAQGEILPAQHTVHTRNFTDCFNISVTLAGLKCKLPADGR